MKVVTIGGGNGQTITLRALQVTESRPEITALATVFDSGGSSGRLRTELGILPPGDLLRAVLALSHYDYQTLRKIFYTHRFPGHPDLAGHSLGNLIIAFLSQRGGFITALETLAKALAVGGRVYPVSIESAQLNLTLDNRQTIVGEFDIGSFKYEQGRERVRLWLEPAVELLPQAASAIASADLIILGPGDLFTSLLPNLVVKSVAEALMSTRAKLVLVLNSANRLNGESYGFKASDYLKEFKKYLPRTFDYIIVQQFNQSILSRYNEAGWEEVVDDLDQSDSRIIRADLARLDQLGTDWLKLSQVFEKIFKLNAN